jgi:peptidoglycan/xylan/chitin deacetylase (PgdA/CDA1 family)
VAVSIGTISPAANAETVVSFTFDDGLSSAPAAGSILTAQGIKATFYIITGEVGTSGFVTWPNVAKLAAEGHEIGAHTVTHPDLPTLTPSEQEEQICGSRKQLEEHGYAPHTFAYPHGDFNLESVRLVQTCEFSSARLFGTYQGGDSPSDGTSIYPEPYSIPNSYELSTQGSPERRIQLQDLENDYVWGEDGWVIIALHGICPSSLSPKESECASQYGPTSEKVLEQYAAWVGEQPETIIRTIGQVVEDPVLPTTAISCDGSACSGPYPSAVTVDLSPTDSNLTVTETHYTTDGSEPTTSSPTYTGAFQVSSTKTVKYRSWDLRGKAEAVKSQTITIDTPPVTTIENEPSNLSNEADATFTFSANKKSTFECSLDGGSYSSCSSPYKTGTLSQGLNTFAVRSTDALGSKETSPPSYEWTVDTVPPTTTIDSEPASLTRNTSASIAFSANESAAFECELDGAGFKACTSPYATTGLGEGQHTFKVKATDTAGNEAAPVSYSWRVDITPPLSTIESRPSSLTKSTSASISFSANESSTFECQLDAGGFKACVSPYAAAGLSDGLHSFSVRAIDTAGNVEPSPPSYEWTVDTTPPVTTIESDALADTESGDVSVDFSVNESATFECSLDGGAYDSCGSPYTAAGLAVGFHTLLIRATDLVGNVESQPVSYLWTVVAPPPPAKYGGPGASPSGEEESPSKGRVSGNPRVVLAPRLGGAVRKRGLPLELYCPESCTARIIVGMLAKSTQSGHTAHLRVLATATTRAATAQTLKLKVKLQRGSAGPIGRAQRRRVRLRVTVTVRLADGSAHWLQASAAIGGQLLGWLR